MVCLENEYVLWWNEDMQLIHLSGVACDTERCTTASLECITSTRVSFSNRPQAGSAKYIRFELYSQVLDSLSFYSVHRSAFPSTHANLHAAAGIAVGAALRNFVSIVQGHHAGVRKAAMRNCITIRWGPPGVGAMRWSWSPIQYLCTQEADAMRHTRWNDNANTVSLCVAISSPTHTHAPTYSPTQLPYNASACQCVPSIEPQHITLFQPQRLVHSRGRQWRLRTCSPV